MFKRRPATSTGGSERGFLIPIGGAEDKTANSVILDRFVELCGGTSANIVVIPTASRMSDTGSLYVQLFEEMGAAIYQKEVNELILRDFYISILIQFFIGFEKFIPIIQNIDCEYPFTGLGYPIRERPDSFKKIVWLHNRWKPLHDMSLKKARIAKRKRQS